MNYKLQNAGHRRPPAPGIDVPEKRTCSERPGGHCVCSDKRILQMHVRTLPAPSITLAAPWRAMGSRKASGALCPCCWLHWITLRRCWGSPPPPTPARPPRPRPQLLQPDSREGWWTQQRAWGGARKCWWGGWGGTLWQVHLITEGFGVLTVERTPLFRPRQYSQAVVTIPSSFSFPGSIPSALSVTVSHCNLLPLLTGISEAEHLLFRRRHPW